MPPPFAKATGGKPNAEPVVDSQPIPAPQILPAEVVPVAPVFKKTDTFGLTKSVSMALAVMLMLVLVLDAFLVYHRKTIRVSGHNLAHLMILFVLLVVLNLINRGVIL